MKLFKRIMATALAAALIAFVPGFNAAKVSAAGDTYSVKYVPDLEEWRVQKLAQWDDTRENGALSYLYGSLRDGDSVVVWGSDSSPYMKDLNLDADVKNLTLYGVTQGIIVHSNKNITDVYVVKGTSVSLHGKYQNVHVYDNCAANVNNDVEFLQVSKDSVMEMNVTAVGTVGHCQIDSKGNVLKDMYNVKADSLRIVKGVDKTDPATYSTTPGAQPAAAPAQPASQPASQPATTTPATTNNGGAVSPKTGEDNYAIWLIAGAAFCFAGAFAAKKKFA